MTSSPRRWSRPAVAIAVLIPLLAGCGSLIGAPERQLYRLTPAFAFPSDLPHPAAQLVIAMPTAPGGLDKRRIALSRSAVSLDYFADVEWTDRVPALVEAALVEGFERSRSIAAVGGEELGLHADVMLETAISEFQATYDSPDAPPRIAIELDAKLIRLPERRILAQTVIRGQQLATANTLAEIVRAFDGAVGRTIRDVVIWTVANPALSQREGSAKSRTPFVHPKRSGAK